MAFFDATLFTVAPRLYRALDEALDPAVRPGAGPGLRLRPERNPSAAGRPFLHWGSWIGGDRDGNPGVTAEITEKTLRIQADHVLRGYEAVATRLMQTIAAATPADRVARPLASRLARDAEDLPETDRQLRRRFPDEPYRQRFGFIAERLRRTRAALTGEPGPAHRSLRRRRPTSTPSSSRSRRRSSPTASAGWPGARSPSCAGSSGRSASISRRSRSASTRAVHAAALGRDPGRPAAVDRGRPGRQPGRSARDVPGDRRGPGAPRRSRPAGATSSASRRRPPTSPTSSSWLGSRWPMTATGPAARRPSTSSRCSSRAWRSRTPGSILAALLDDPVYRDADPVARRSPGGDARLLGLQQGAGLPGRRLDAPAGPGRDGRGRPVRGASS